MMENNNNSNAGAVDSTTKEPKRKYYIQRSLNTDATGMDKLTPDEKAADLKRSMAILLEWPNWDIWPFKISAPLVGAAAAVPGLILNRAFRGALLLGHFGKTSSYIATMGLPMAFAGAGHHLMITADILKQQTKCPVCLQVKSATLQIVTGFLYPLLLAPLTSFPIASGMKNLYFPKFHKQPREVLHFALDVLRTVKNPLLAVGIVQIVCAMGITSLQQDCYYKVLLPVLRGDHNFSKETRKREFYK